jgi:DNA processing protein
LLILLLRLTTSLTPEHLNLPTLSPPMQQIIDATIACDTLSFDAIVYKTGSPASSVASALFQLELMSLISQLPGMRYQKI